ncbi:hypothetical protein [Mesobacillus boroniphilus]|uniref:Glycosyltransferase RgtA/B/C/D-like domain-containing protein n=1 Tax=Mesobacillus boroniphilus JCM 21738 TaxID=1294265 RepID=W4RJ71_9BACI|nr:hypothetical protein [Mesobacillus boroniphilus]GAE44197.1 hypothetical protein JCM21738_884 [Mesobacillus boroniphilus JCM 21738]
MNIGKPYIKIAITFFYFFFIICLSVYSFIKPYYSYDLIPYTAVTLSLSEDDPQKVHAKTYDIIEKALPKEVFHNLTSGEFGRKMFEDYSSFTQQLNFYKVKPLYIALIYSLHELGIDIVKAINLISVLSFLGISILLFLFLYKLRSGAMGLILLTLLMVCQPLIFMAARNTPDALSAFMITLALYFLLKTNLRILPGILFILSILVRPDNLILSSLFIIYFGMFAQKEFRFKFYQAVGFLLISALVYFTVNQLAGGYGWKMLFTVSFIQFIEKPAETVVSISFENYIKVLVGNGLKLLNTHIIYFIVIGFIALLISKVEKGFSVFNHLILISILGMAGYFIIFPSGEVDRYFITQYLIILVSALSVFCQEFKLSEKNQ